MAVRSWATRVVAGTSVVALGVLTVPVAVSAVTLRAADRAIQTDNRNGAIRVAHDLDGIARADVLVDGRRRVGALSSIASDGLSAALVLSAGHHRLELRSSDATARNAGPSSAVVAFDVVPDATLAVVVVGSLSTPVVRVVPIDPPLGPSRASVRVLNITTLAVTVHIAKRASSLAPLSSSGSFAVDHGVVAVQFQSANGDLATTVRASAGSGSFLVLRSNATALTMHQFDVRPLPVAALGVIDSATVRHGFAATVLVDDGLWLRRVLSGVVVLLVVLATASTLAAFRNETMEGRVRDRMNF